MDDSLDTHGGEPMSPMTLQTVTVRIPTEREAAADVEVANGGLPTIPTEARMLPQAPLYKATGVSGQEHHLGVPFEVAEAIEVGDLIALPDRDGRPWATYEVLAEVGPWAEAFALPEGVEDDQFAGWVHLSVAPARDRLSVASEAAQWATTYAEMNRAAERARVQSEMRRRAVECTEIVDKLKSVGPELAARAVQHVLDDDGRDALLAALNRAELEQEPAAA